MRIVLKILGVIVGLIVLLLIIALFVSREYTVEREVVINKPKQTVFDYVKMVRNQESYNVWTMADPNAKKEYKGTDGTVGFVYGWNGNDQVGEGELEIKQIVEGEKVNMELRFKRPMESTAQTYMHTASVSPETTKVIWGMTGSSPYPFNLMTLLMKGTLEKDLQKSLDNMKNNIEK
jgi:hypothetical protein